jgi:hypothetical protein
MADPNAALATQLRNIEAKTGKTLDQLRQLLAASGLAKHGEKRSFLMTTLGLGHGDANTVVHLAAQPAAGGVAGGGDDALAAIYTGAKAHLRPLHEAVIAAIDGLGPYEQAPKKAYVSLRRNKQFAMLGPATKDQVELGLNIKDLPPHPRLKALAPGGMCQYTVRLATPGEIDADLLGWLRKAYEGAG